MVGLSSCVLVAQAALPDLVLCHVFRGDEPGLYPDFLAGAGSGVSGTSGDSLSYGWTMLHCTLHVIAAWLGLSATHEPSGRSEVGTILRDGSLGSLTMPASEGDRRVSAICAMQ